MDLIARAIATPKGIFGLSWIVSGATAVAILAFGVPAVAMAFVAFGGPMVLSASRPWAERRLGRR